MSAYRLFDKFKALLDVSWGSIADGQLLQRSGTNIIGQTLTKPVIGDTAQGTNPANSVIVPAFTTHPDRIFSGTPSAFDDHFDGTTLNAKWTPTFYGNGTASVGGSHLMLAAINGDGAGAAYSAYVQQDLPNANSFNITFKVQPNYYAHTVTSSIAMFGIQLRSFSPAITGMALEWSSSYVSGVGGIHTTVQKTGANCANSFAAFYGPALPSYVRLFFDRPSYGLSPFFSSDGINWSPVLFGIDSATSGLNATYLPQQFVMYVHTLYWGQSLASIDWVKFVNT